MFRLTRRGRRRSSDEDEKIARLEKAEGDLRDLQERGNRAISALDARHHRNHWREAIEQMITGAI